MQLVKPCNTYHAVVPDRALFRGADGRTAFKVYYVDVIGRADPSRTEWAKCGLTKEAFMLSLAKTPGIEGVGFITAFPHITKAFRFGPEAETVVNVRAWNTRDMSPLDLSRSDAYAEFACLAEAAVAADEFAFWATAESVEDYLQKWSVWRDGPIARNDKLCRYWEAGGRK